MSGISLALNIARGALMAQQRGIDVTGHNIANVNTPGYTRQRLILEASAVDMTNRLKVGYGVGADTVIQNFDRLATKSIHRETSILSKYKSDSSVLGALQATFNEEAGSGLSAVLDGFWNAWQDLSDNPGGNPERMALLEKGRMLSERFHGSRDQLVQMQGEMNNNIGMALDQVNTITGQIAILNERIVSDEAIGTSANDFRDERNTLLEKLSGFVEIAYIEDNRGSMLVFTGNGTSLVNGNQASTLRMDGNQIVWNDLPYDISRQLEGGQIGAWLDLRDETLPEYLANLDELAGSLIYQVNRLHFGGYGKDGSTGNTFFIPNPGDDYALSTPGGSFAGAAASISVSGDVDQHPDLIAAGGAPGEPGNNGNALAIQTLQDGEIEIRKWTYRARGSDVSAQDQTSTMDEYYTVLVGDVGLLGEENNQSIDFHQTLLDQMNDVRDSISGVNLDEEMINLIQYQHAFGAASKLVTTADQMLQDLLQLR
jgi:flagellar hook-associated protein 1